MKGLFDVVEGGTVQGTRYRPANFPSGGALPRIFNMNGTAADMGRFFSKYEMHGVASIVSALAVDELDKAVEYLRSCDMDSQAQVRRITLALCTQKDALVTEDTIAHLRTNTAERTDAGKRRRQAYEH